MAVEYVIDPEAKGVEYQVTKVDPTDPETKGKVYQVHKVDEVTAYMSGKFYRARVIKDPADPTVRGKVYQIVLVDDPDDPSVKGKVYNAIITGDQEAVVIGPAVPPLDLPDAISDGLEYVKAYGDSGVGVPTGFTQLEYVYNDGTDVPKVVTDWYPDFTKDVHISGKAMYMGSDTSYISVLLSNYSVGSGNYPATVGVWFFGVNGNKFRINTKGENDSSNSQETGSLYKNSIVSFDVDFTSTDGKYSIETANEGVEAFAGNKTNKASGYKCGYPMCVFADYRSNTSGIQNPVRIYGLTATENGKTVLDLVPAKRDYDGEIGFYDRVSGKFYVNTGTGTLTGDPISMGTYTRLTSLYSAGDIWLDTGIVPSDDFGYKVEINCKEVNSNAAKFGVREDSSDSRCWWGAYSARSWWAWNTNLYTNITDMPTLNSGVFNTTEINLFNSRLAKLNGVTASNVPTLGTLTTFTRSFFLFRTNDQGQTPGTPEANGRRATTIRYAMFTKGNEIIAYFVPVKRNSDNTLGLLNIITNTFIAGSGTGSFVAGSDVPVMPITDTLPSRYMPIEYIENANNGTRFNTGQYFTNDDWAIQIKAAATTGSNYLFQARSDSSGTITGISGSLSGNTIMGMLCSTGTITLDMSRTVGNIYDYTLIANSGNGSMTVKNLTANTSETKTAVYTGGTTSTAEIGIFGNTANNYLAAGARVYYARYWKSGQVVLNWVPVMDTKTAKYGFYDTVSRQFIERNTGSVVGSLEVMPTIANPTPVCCNNGALKAIPVTADLKVSVSCRIMPETGVWAAYGGASCLRIPLTVGKQYFICLNENTTDIDDKVIRYGQSPTYNPNNTQLVDWYNGFMSNGMVISFKAKQPYFIIQVPNSIFDTLIAEGTISVLEAQGVNERLQMFNDNYTIVDGLRTASASFDTGVTYDSTKSITLILSAQTPNTETSNRPFVGFGAGAGQWLGVNSNKWTIGTGGVSTISASTKTDDIEVNWYNGTESLSIGGTSIGSRSATNVYGASLILSRVPGTTITNTIYSAKVIVDGTLVRDLVPAKRKSDNVLGFYDFVTGEFITSATGTITAGAALTSIPMAEVEANNLLYMKNTDGTYVDKHEIISGLITRQLGFKVFNGTETFDLPAVTLAECYSWRCGNVLGTSTYKNRMIFCSHLGTANQTSVPAVGSRTGLAFRYFTDGGIAFGTADNFATVDDWLAWLQQQFAEGFPFYVIYPRKTEYTQVAPVPQTINVVEGDNVLDITQSALPDLEVEVKYTKEG